MKATTSSYRESLPAVDVTVIDQVCTEFEHALRNGENPRIEEFLSKLSGRVRERVLEELLLLEMERRAGLGEDPPLDEYRRRFSDDLRLMKSIYLQVFVPPSIGRFRVEGVLGQGGFGRVYRAFDQRLERYVAVKMLLGHKLRSAGTVDELIRDARFAARLDHAAIVHVYDVGEDEDGDHFVVLECIDGTSMQRAMDDCRSSFQRTVEVVITVVEGLQHAHENGLYHRDLKPANILLDKKGQPHITDFGLAVDERTQRFRAGEVAGTPPYMAPEQVAGEVHRIDGRTDIWALGVILYELLTGRRPFDGETPDEVFYAIRHLDPKPVRERNRSVPVPLARITLKCLAKRMSDRYSCAADLISDLRIARDHVNGDPAVQRDDRTGVDGGRAPAAPTLEKTPSKPARVIPKGLRSYDRHDADFFLRLLPGPRNLDGVPESVRFWQNRIDETDGDDTFSIGLIYGPSGCGKSSFVKAGLLPRLAEHVTPVFVEATREDTEVRLIKSLRKQFPDLPEEMALPNIVAVLREGQWLAPGKKIVIVLDQFEQWLHSNPTHDSAQLIDALRQCDGGRVQAVILIRDDFWMQVTRLFHALEVPLFEGHNSAAVDKFDVSHAGRVLGEFGQAYEKLSDQQREWTDQQRQFLERSATGLADDGFVTPVRLALFAEMIKAKPWTAQTFAEVGGAEGVGVAFLEETFASRTAAPEHRRHGQAARGVLERLLPDEGTDIRGHMRSERELREASRYTGPPEEFERLVHILDAELRLITPTDPTGQLDAHGDALPVVSDHQTYYQLTHDYLVPAIRTWLTRKKRETARGRAQLRLAERAAAYRAQPHPRQLPSLWQWFSILALTRRRHDGEAQRRMLRAANRRHLARLSAAAAIVAVLAWIAYETVGRIRTTGYVNSLATAETADVPGITDSLAPYRRWADPELRDIYDNGEGKERLHAAMALLPVSRDVLDYLLHELLQADAESFASVRDAILEYGDVSIARKTLWDELDIEPPSSDRLLRASMALATYDPGGVDGDWNRVVSDNVLEAWIGDIAAHPSHFEYWLEALYPIREVLNDPVTDAFYNADENPQMRYLAAAILAHFQRDKPEILVDLVADSEPEQFPPLQSALLAHVESAIPLLTDVCLEHKEPEATEDAKDTIASRQANAAVSLFELGDRGQLEKRLVPTDDGDRRLQSWLIDRFSHAASSDSAHRGRLEKALTILANQSQAAPKDAELRYAMTLIVGSIAEQVREDDYRARVVRQLSDLYKSDPDSGVHSAAEWALRTCGAESSITRMRQDLCGKPPIEGGGWFVSPSCQTMVIIEAPGEIVLGSPPDEPGHETDERFRPGRIPNPFAVSVTEVTARDFRRLLPKTTIRIPNEFNQHESGPMNGASFLDALKYCRRLSEDEAIPEDQMCYPPIDQIREEFKPDLRLLASRSGYRLLTNAEWEYVCRAGSRTPRSYGYAPKILGNYAWYSRTSGSSMHPVGRLLPNRFGLFDTYGNAREWTTYFVAFISNKSILRGGSYAASAQMLRSANWSAGDVAVRSFQNGFRIARTLKHHSHPKGD